MTKYDSERRLCSYALCFKNMFFSEPNSKNLNEDRQTHTVTALCGKFEYKYAKFFPKGRGLSRVTLTTRVVPGIGR